MNPDPKFGVEKQSLTLVGFLWLWYQCVDGLKFYLYSRFESNLTSMIIYWNLLKNHFLLLFWVKEMGDGRWEMGWFPPKKFPKCCVFSLLKNPLCAGGEARRVTEVSACFSCWWCPSNTSKMSAFTFWTDWCWFRQDWTSLSRWTTIFYELVVAVGGVDGEFLKKSFFWPANFFVGFPLPTNGRLFGRCFLFCLLTTSQQVGPSLAGKS